MAQTEQQKSDLAKAEEAAEKLVQHSKKMAILRSYREVVLRPVHESLSGAFGQYRRWSDRDLYDSIDDYLNTAGYPETKVDRYAAVQEKNGLERVERCSHNAQQMLG